ncbi:MAG: carbohydrate binding domain-containing protein [Bacteroidales bacterium]|nr:carbohydrate binding domain-containing protein [Candidatus Liminaster caballi]
MKKFLLSLAAVAFVMSANAEDTNLLQNPGFESWTESTPDHWKSASTASNATLSQSTDAHSGSYSVTVASASSNKRLATEEMTVAAGSYTFTFYAKAATDTIVCKCRPGYVPVDADNKVGSYVYTSATDPVLSATEWTAVSFTFELAAETRLNLLVMNPKNGGSILVDDASLVCTSTGDNGGGDNGGDKDKVAEEISIADFLAKADTATVFQLKGVVENIKNTTYGNFDLVQGESSIYIYGLLDLQGAAKNFASLDVAVGDTLTLQGVYTEYNGNPQIKNAQYVSHVKAHGATDISNTAETAYSVSEANALIAAGKGLATPVYVKGEVVADPVPEVSVDYGNATFTITDGTETIVVFRAKYLENAKFTSEDQLKVGDKVVVFGTLKDYNGTYELTSGYVYAINDETSISSVAAQSASAEVFNILGQRVSNMSQKGIYVVNGKKVIVK